MSEIKRDQGHKKENGSEVRVVVEVNGNPVGFVELDMDRLWPLINHGRRDGVPVEWVERSQFETALRASVSKRLMGRLEEHLYRALGDQLVKAELDIEAFILKTEAAGQAFGRTKLEVERLVEDSGRTSSDFYAFFWDYLLADRESVDPKKEWKASRNRPQ